MMKRTFTWCNKLNVCLQKSEPNNVILFNKYYDERIKHRTMYWMVIIGFIGIIFEKSKDDVKYIYDFPTAKKIENSCIEKINSKELGPPIFLKNKENCKYKDNYLLYCYLIFRIKIFGFMYYTVFRNKDKFGNLGIIENELEKINKNNNMTDYQKIKYVKNLVTYFITYDTKCESRSKEVIIPESQYKSVFLMPPSLIMERRLCVCGGYSVLTAHLLNKLNVSSRVATSMTQQHATVVVFIDGKKYFIEPQDPKNILYEV